jgi:hypothetical protein
MHGEPQQAAALAHLLRGKFGLEITVPAPGQSFALK